MSKTNLNNFKMDKVRNTLNNFKMIYPNLWKRLIDDKDLYIDIRKNNNIEIYYNGWCLFNISEKCICTNTKFIPFHKFYKNEYIRFENNISHKIEINFSDFENAEIDVPANKKHATLIGEMKKIINKYSKPEKTIQGKYATNANKWKGTDEDGKIYEKNGIILDTEFAFDDNDEKNRIDLVYLSKKDMKLYFVELKRSNDYRLKPSSAENIKEQIISYHNLLSNESDNLLEYYKKVFKIKKEFNLMNKFVDDNEFADIDINKLTIEDKPILLIGNKQKKSSDFETKIKNSNNEFYKSIRENIFESKPICNSIDRPFLNLGN